MSVLVNVMVRLIAKEMVIRSTRCNLFEAASPGSVNRSSMQTESPSVVVQQPEPTYTEVVGKKKRRLNQKLNSKTSKTAESNESNNRSAERGRVQVVGTAKPTTMIKAMDTVRLCVGNLDDEVTPNDFRDFITENGGKVLACSHWKTFSGENSSKLFVKLKHANVKTWLDPHIWPEGIRVREFRGKDPKLVHSTSEGDHHNTRRPSQPV